jgi:hypothetical protein
MNEREDERLGQALRDAPPERDALFRLSVIERRERQRFQRRSVGLTIASILFLAVVSFGWSAGAGLVVTAASVALGAGLIVACIVSAPGVTEILRRLRTSQVAAPKG